MMLLCCEILFFWYFWFEMVSCGKPKTQIEQGFSILSFSSDWFGLLIHFEFRLLQVW